jgi:predicted protein tyrosine phosphatase/membrane-associated phospholipid phosphatase
MGHVFRVAGSAQRSLIFHAARTSVFLSILFIMVYGSTNWFTAHRRPADVHTWYFSWEPAVIPYVPWLIVPYMSMDVLFFMAVFLCKSEEEISIFTRRVTFSILAAGALFLLLPLRLAWPARPRAGGWFGDLVEASCTAPFLMEYPHNLFPALHITLCLIVAALYLRHTAGIWRILFGVWFGLIACSTVLTWQHHVVDIFGGLALAGCAFYLFGEAASKRQQITKRRIGAYYATGSIALLGVAIATRPWGALLVWPGTALGIVAAGYFGTGARIFTKEHGRISRGTRMVLAPVLLGHYLSLAYYRRYCHAWDEIVPRLRIGRILSEREAKALIAEGLTAVLDLSAEFSESPPLLTVNYRNIAVLDLTPPSQEQLRDAAEFIARHTETGIVYVHCKIGYSRSAAAVGAYLLASGRAASAEDAVARLRQVRPSIVVRPEAMEALGQFAAYVHAFERGEHTRSSNCVVTSPDQDAKHRFVSVRSQTELGTSV